MRRRQFLGAMAAAVVLPQVGRAQESQTYRIGILNANSRRSPLFLAFFDELRRSGFVEGRNLIVEDSGIGVPFSRFPELAREMVSAKVEVLLVGGGGPPIRSVQSVATSIPIIGVGDDMVAEGLVRSLAEPGGNLTGISILAPELDGKRLELLVELLPGVRRIAALSDTKVQSSQQRNTLEEAARARGIELITYSITSADNILPAINAARDAGAGGVNLLASSLINSHRRSIIERTAALRMPTMYQWPDVTDEGALIAYGPPQTHVYRQIARMAAKVLRGAKVAELPVEQPALFELAINLETAKAIGLIVPMSLLTRADKVI